MRRIDERFAQRAGCIAAHRANDAYRTECQPPRLPDKRATMDGVRAAQKHLAAYMRDDRVHHILLYENDPDCTSDCLELDLKRFARGTDCDALQTTVAKRARRMGLSESVAGDIVAACRDSTPGTASTGTSRRDKKTTTV